MSEDPGRDVVIFTEAVRLPAEQRAAFVDRACAGDDNLRRKVLALLDAHERVGDFLENPPFQGGHQGGTDSQTGDGQRGPGTNGGKSK
jgi:hypothetical protein